MNRTDLPSVDDGFKIPFSFKYRFSQKIGG